MAGVTFTISQNNQIVSQGISTGSNSAVCFENILPGDYVITQVLPINLSATTQSSAIIPVNAGSTVSTVFGSRIAQPSEDRDVPDATPVAEDQVSDGDGVIEIVVPEDSSSDDDGLGATAIIGLVAISMAVILLGALVFIMLRQQRG